MDGAADGDVAAVVELDIGALGGVGGLRAECDSK